MNIPRTSASSVLESKQVLPGSRLPDKPAPTWPRGEVIALAVALLLIIVAAVVGHEMNQRGLPIVLPRPPLLAFWHPHVCWGTPLGVLCVILAAAAAGGQRPSLASSAAHGLATEPGLDVLADSCGRATTALD